MTQEFQLNFVGLEIECGNKYDTTTGFWKNWKYSGLCLKTL